MKPEKEAEREFAKRIKDDFNLKAIKFKDSARRGGPDRLVLLPGMHCLFFEFKKPNKDLREEQEDYKKWLEVQGHRVYKVTDWRTPYDLVASYFRRFLKEELNATP